MPGRVEYQPVTLEAGLTNDRDLRALGAPARSDHERHKPEPRVAEPDFRREVEIRVYDIDNTDRRAASTCCTARGCRSTPPMSDLAGDGNDIIIETLEVTHEGYERLELA